MTPTTSTTLNPTQTRRVLSYLGLDRAEPNLHFLVALLDAYVRKVPWESASRIVRRANTAATEQCPRWPEEFWEGTLTLGTGGTCFESNYAFMTLLRSLGFRGYLTINDMNETVGCHTASVIELDGAQWLTDAGFPVHAPVRLDSTQPSESRSQWLTYVAKPLPDEVFVIERHTHPSPYCFTVRNKPIDEAAYRAATTHDYGPNGLFLTEININKVIDDQLWRFSTRDDQPNMHTFVHGQRIPFPIALTSEDPAAQQAEIARAVSAKFGIDAALLREGLQVLA